MAAVLPPSLRVEPTPFVPKRSIDIKDQLELKRRQDGAMYSLEFPVVCPHCEEHITTFRVFRLLRTQVSFTSTLPRKGYVIVCPECERPISSELSGLI
jgi:hypothetical protein